MKYGDLFDRCCGERPRISVFSEPKTAQCMSCGETVVSADEDSLVIDWNIRIRKTATNEQHRT